MNVERARELLAAERMRIEHTLAYLWHQDDGEEADVSHPSNLAADLYRDELDESLAEVLHEQIAALERAEDRLAAGTYGLSVESGLPIPDERLEALPTAELTTEEARAQTSRRPRLLPERRTRRPPRAST
jgi:DnaK suppressor protein